MASRRKTVVKGLIDKLPGVCEDGAFERQPGRQPASGSGVQEGCGTTGRTASDPPEDGQLDLRTIGNVTPDL